MVDEMVKNALLWGDSDCSNFRRLFLIQTPTGMVEMINQLLN